MRSIHVAACIVLGSFCLALNGSHLLEPASRAEDSKAADPLPSWKDGPTKKAILDYVARVTDKSHPDYIPPEDRIATFDNDGTLWCEMPLAEVVFTKQRLQALAAKDPAMKNKQPFKAALEDDHEYFRKAGMKALFEIVVATHGNEPQEAFDENARDFLKTAKHPKFGVLYPQLAYQPMVELLRHLRANGFQTWICSGGFMDFMRHFTQETYGIPPQQVIGSSMKKKSIQKDGRRILMLLSEVQSYCDEDDKPVEIGFSLACPISQREPGCEM
jgi:phosphoglycolate phosphatase-like HAD superfamily hydrolase